MMRHRIIAGISPRIAMAILLSVFCVFAAGADEISRIGRGVAVVFSPDFSDPGNRQFYERLGFVYFETPDWREVLEGIEDHNAEGPNVPIRVVLIESHGTNGNGLKLQAGKQRTAARSYISVGALQELLEPSGVERVILSACNSGRLLRPEIYLALDRQTVDALFLPATLGFVDASPGFDPTRSRVKILRRVQSNLETLLHGSTLEMGRETAAILNPDSELRFAVSTMLIQILIEDERLELTDRGYVREKSRADLSLARSEELFRTFCRFLSARATERSGAGVDPPSPLLAVR